jgi:hypothetical protein
MLSLGCGYTYLGYAAVQSTAKGTLRLSSAVIRLEIRCCPRTMFVWGNTVLSLAEARLELQVLPLLKQTTGLSSAVPVLVIS